MTPENSKYSHLPLSTSGPIECAVSGHVLLNNPIFNRGSAHSKEERREFELTGLLPQSIHTLDQQVSRAYEQYSSKPDDLAKNTFLTSLMDQNYVLYYKVSIRSRPTTQQPNQYRHCLTLAPAPPRPHQGDVQRSLYTHRRRSHPELLPAIPTSRRLLPEHQGH